MNFTELTFERFSDVLDLIMRTDGVSVREADSPEAVSRYLERNPGFSFIAEDDSALVACAMCGHDGRRGYLQHVIVDKPYRGQGLANELVNRCLTKLESIGIVKCHIDVLVDNTTANEYWTRRGWLLRKDIYRYSFNRSEDENA